MTTEATDRISIALGRMTRALNARRHVQELEEVVGLYPLLTSQPTVTTGEANVEVLEQITRFLDPAEVDDAIQPLVVALLRYRIALWNETPDYTTTGKEN